MVKNFLRLWHVSALVVGVALAGCGGSDGAAGPQGEQGPPGQQGEQGPPGTPGANGGSGSFVVGSNALTNASAIQANADAWAELEPTVEVTGVTIASPPVVNFKVTDGFGRPVIGLGNQTTSAGRSGTYANGIKGYSNLAFSLAKLVPGSNGGPSHWVSYMVVTVPTTSSPDPAPTRPGTDNTGTLVDNGDGTYQYTFYNDVTTVKSRVDAMTVSGNNNKADLGDLTYNANLTHRLTIQLSGNAPGTGTNTPTGAASAIDGVPIKAANDAIYDFIPATGAVTASSFSRDIVANSNCENCHRKLGGIPGLSEAEDAAGFHGGSRNNVQYCVVCHTEQRKYGQVEAAVASTDGAIKTFTSAGTRVLDGRAIGNLPNYIHKVHLSKLLVHQNYDYAGVSLNEPTYPQDIRNCTSCHDGTGVDPTRVTKTKDGDNWKTKPSALACGACHDGINFATGTGVTLRDKAAGLTTSNINNTGIAHPAGPLADDSQCALCHKSNGTFPLADIDLSHFPVTPPNPDNSLLAGGTNNNTNAAWIASGGSVGRLPPGAIKVSYDIKSVSAWPDPAANGTLRPRMVFRMLQNCDNEDVSQCTSTNLNDVATTIPNPATGQKEIWDNFMGAPSLQFVFAVPQDGIAAPADFNASVSSYLRCLWNGTAPVPDPDQCVSAGTLTGPDADGFYTATLTGAIVPADAVMLTGGLGYSYNVKNTLPLTQTNLPGYPTAAATGSNLTAGMPNATGGLIVIAPNVQKVATGYSGRRAIVEDARCNKCHQELGTFTEDAFHAGQRNDATTCSWCHTPNRTSSGWSADSTSFVHAIHASAKRTVPYNWHAVSETENFSEVTYPGILNDCQTCHRPGTFDFSATPAAAVANRLLRTVGQGTYSASISNSPYIELGVAYGSGFGFNATTGVTTPAALTTLVTSPTVTVCVACHETPDAIAHFASNAGTFYQPRSSAATETCLVCHGTGRIADIAVMHSKNR